VFRYRSYLWLVDLDRLPRIPLLTVFRGRDHLGDPRRGIRENLDRFLAANGISRPHTITMLTQARVLGYVFNPLTVYWCHRPDCVVAEVHNTYAAEVIAALLAQAGLDLPVRLRAWDGSEAGPLDSPVLVARSPRALQRMLWRPGELGLARAYVSGDLDVEGDLTDGLRRAHATAPRSGPFGLIKTGPAVVAAAARLGLFAPPPEPPRCELRVRGRRHSRARDQAVIAGHYDVPPAFYQLILDPSMAYSCGYWDGQRDLNGAQQAKLDLIMSKLALEPGQALLDVGCGWGSLTLHAARARVQVTGVTLSREQGGYVRQRALGRGLGDRAEVRIQDYRDPLDGQFDAIASVEMGEHVGAARYPAFCAALYGKAAAGRTAADPADVQDHPPRRRPVHRVLHRPRHGHAPGGGDDTADPGRRVRGHRGRGDAGALRAHDPGLAGELRG
jgi:hypothetical protein